MTKEQQQVKDFMVAAEQDCPSKPSVASDDIQRLRIDLIEEELNELMGAFVENNEVKIADAIGDLLYVVIGTAVSCGIDMEPIFQEIHRSNMSKFIDGHKREDGKWIKGPSYSLANLKPILDEQSK